MLLESRDTTIPDNDFLNVSTTSQTADANRRVIFNKQSTDDDNWSNFPSEVAGRTWVGVRRVYYRGSGLLCVEIVEIFPKYGRTWYNLYKSSKWYGWVSTYNTVSNLEELSKKTVVAKSIKSSSVTVGANEGKEVTFSFTADTGYTCVGIGTLNTGNMWLYPAYWYFSATNKLNLILKNTSSSSVTTTVTVNLLFVYTG